MHYIFIPIIKKGREGGDILKSIVILLILNGKIDFCISCVVLVASQDLRIFVCMLVLVTAWFRFLVCASFSSSKDFSLALTGQALFFTRFVCLLQLSGAAASCG
jgi:hypothetical protein